MNSPFLASLTEAVVLRPATLLKKRLWHRCFPVNFAEFLRTTFLTEQLRWLLLKTSINSQILSMAYYVNVSNNHYVFIALLKRYQSSKHCSKLSHRDTRSSKLTFVISDLRLWHRCFPVNFARFLRAPFPYRTPPVAVSVFEPSDFS